MQWTKTSGKLCQTKFTTDAGSPGPAQVAPLMTVAQLARCAVSRRISIILLSQPDSEPRTLIPGLTFYRDARASATESPSTPLMLYSQERLPRPGDQMMARVTDELKNVTYRVDLTAEGAILHMDPNTVKAVIDCLESHHKLTHETLKLPPGTANPRSKSSSTDPRLPSDALRTKMIHTNLWYTC